MSCPPRSSSLLIITNIFFLFCFCMREAMKSVNGGKKLVRGRGRGKMATSSTTDLEACRHVEWIRSKKFAIGKKHSNPLTQDLHYAVTSLSMELYTKDVHFLMEIIQNAEDNEYEEGVEPTLEFVLTTKDVTGTGSPATLFVFNNEVGFSATNMESICSVGRSTKKGKRKLGYIGEKGIGFKSVFLVSSQPHIFSNGYRVKFGEEPNPDCGIGYIVPEWVGVGEKPSSSDLHDVYGRHRNLPTTTIVLPLKPEKVEAVKAQLSELHPELLLFLSKLKRLHVTKNGFDPGEDDDVSVVSMSSETDHVELSDKGADSRVVRLSVKEKMCGSEETCNYFVWRHRFPVKPESVISARMDVQKLIITLAFPFGERLRRGTSFVGIFAFLPTTMVTNFPFIIQADFILASSRETIVLDNPWNLGILECVPAAFLNAFQACLEEVSVCEAFEFLPAQASPIRELNNMRVAIRNQLQDLKIVPYELFSGEKVFIQPRQAIRIQPNFRHLLLRIKSEGGSLDGLSALKKVLHSSLDHKKYTEVLNFVGVLSVEDCLDWYAKCIQSCNLVAQASEDVYVELLCFIAKNEKLFPHSYSLTLTNVPLLKYNNGNGNSELCTISETSRSLKVKYALDTELHSWLNKCNMKFGCLDQMFFLPDDTQKSLVKHPKRQFLCNWLSHSANVMLCSAYDYGCKLHCHKELMEPNLTISLAHFLYHAHRKKFINASQIFDLCAKIPVIDGMGQVRTQRSATMVSASGSKWVKLFGPQNPFLGQNYIDIGDAYAKNGLFLEEHTPEMVLLTFMCGYSKAVDLPELYPPNTNLKIASSELSMGQAFLLLDWIRLLRTKGSSIPLNFIESIQDGKWMKTYSGYKSPRRSILPDETGKAIYDMMKDVISDISTIDEEFYMNRIILYQDELRFLGTGFGSNDVRKSVTNRFKSLASCGIGRNFTFSLLKFIGFLKQKNMVDEQWLADMKIRKWLKTHQGCNAPCGSIFLQSCVKAESCKIITNLPVVDEAYYGSQLDSFSSELRLLGVITDVDELYNLIAENVNFPANHPPLTGGSGLLILECIRHSASRAVDMIKRISDKPWLKTISGFKRPSETILPDSRWGSLLSALKVPSIDESFYGNEIRHFKNELEAAGVAVDNAKTVEIIAAHFKSLVRDSKLAPADVISLLCCLKELSQNMSLECSELEWLLTEKWLKTRHGYKAPKESIIFSSKWAVISTFVDLPLIDDGFYGIGIYKFRDELHMLGVITDFERGASFVVKGLNSPIESELITVEGTISLLECIKYVMLEPLDRCLPDNFLENIAKSRFLKTRSGYVAPEECVIFDSAWENILKQSDVPTIDAKFYGIDIFVYKDQLRAIGVKVDPMDVCSLLSGLLLSLTETPLIKRIYNFLEKFWRIDVLSICNSQVWIPDCNGTDGGKWENSQLCVLHDRDNLFDSRLYSLDKYYDKELLPFFFSAYGVVEGPSLNNYLELWNSWALKSNYEVTAKECCSFWRCVIEIWNSDVEDILKQKLTKLPAVMSGKIYIVCKKELVIPDDLQLKKVFLDSVTVPVFVWVPKSSSLSSDSRRRLFEIYESLGVKKLSKSVVCLVGNMQSLEHSKMANPRHGLMSKNFAKLVLGFLAGPRVNMPLNERHMVTKSLLDLSVYVSKPLQICFRLLQFKKKRLQVESRRMVFWDKNTQRLLVDKSGYDGGKADIEFVTGFAQEIAQGLLAHVRPDATKTYYLSKAISMGFMFEFEEKEVEFLLTSENLELSHEDEEFLDAVFPFTGNPAVGKRSPMEALGPSTPMPLRKRLCQ